MADQVNNTTRQDLPDWARPYGAASLLSIYDWLFPDREEVTKDGKTDVNLGAPASYEDIGGPLAPFLTNFTPLEQAGQQMAVNNVKSGQPIRQASDQWMYNALGGDPNAIDSNSDLSRQYESYMTGGPLAGASRVSLYDALMGNNQSSASQYMLDQLYGGTANQAQQAAYNTLGNQRDLATDASMWSFTGPLAGQARGQASREINGENLKSPTFNASQRKQLDTIMGSNLSPTSNPYLKSNLDTGLKSISDAYKYATAPSTAAQFARSGSFGGSAHQQTAAMQQFDLGRNLSDFSNQFLGENYGRERQNQEAAINAARGEYQQERGNQLGVLGNERNFSQSALEAERGRQYGTQENQLNRSSDAASRERDLWSQLLDNQLTRGMQASEGELGRGVQVQSILPQLMQARYQDSDVLRSLGSETRNLIDAQNQIQYQNDQQKFQWPFRLYDILGSGLANFTGGGSTTTQTGTNPNALSPAAQGIGLGALGVGALSSLGNWLYPSGSGGAPTGGSK